MIEDITKERVLNFTGKDSIFVKLTHSPKDYIEQIKKMDHEITLVQTNSTHTKDFYDELREMVKYCSDRVCIKNCEIMGETPNKEEFFDGEQIIDKLISEVDSEWNTKQKAAFIHYKMGKILSYVADFKYIENDCLSKTVNDSRNMWISLANGKSVCNGIVNINRSILSRLGIESEELSSKGHSYLFVKTEDGNIITDPTWDLEGTLYDCRPNFFGRTYEDLRKIDRWTTSHKLENPPEDVIEIDDKELREIYHSIGLTNEDKTFFAPLLRLTENINSREICDKSERVNEFLTQYMDEFKEESTHISESISMLGLCMKEIGIDFVNLRCVYLKEDTNCEKPIMVFHSGEEGLSDKIFIFPRDEKGKLQEQKIVDFDEKYKIHSEDTREPFWKMYMDKSSISKEENNREL